MNKRNELLQSGKLVLVASRNAGCFFGCSTIVWCLAGQFVMGGIFGLIFCWFWWQNAQTAATLQHYVDTHPETPNDGLSGKDSKE